MKKLLSQKGFISPPIIVLIVIIGIVLVIALSPSIKNKLNSGQVLTNNSPESSQTQDRVYYVSYTNEYTSPSNKENVNYIDVPSGAQGKLDTKLDVNVDGRYNPPFRITNPDYAIQLTPDKKHFIFKKNSNLWVMDTDGKNLKQLTTERTVKESDCPVLINKFLISPDSQKVFYRLGSDYYEKGGATRRADGTICIPTLKNQPDELIVDLVGKKQKLNRDKEDYRGTPISWTPDSKGIYYAYSGSYSGENGGKQFIERTVRFDVETGTTTEVVKDQISTIFWNKDASKIVYVAGAPYRSETSIYASYGPIYITDKDFTQKESHPFRVGVPEGEALIKSEYKWEWWRPWDISPDGKYVILTRVPQIHHANSVSDYWENRHLGQKVEVYLWDTETNQETKLPIIVTEDTKLKFSTDGKRLIYRNYIEQLNNDDPRGDALYIYDLKTKQQKMMVDLDAGYEFTLY